MNGTFGSLSSHKRPLPEHQRLCMSEPAPDDVAFLVIAGSLVRYSKEIKDLLKEAGFDVSSAYLRVLTACANPC